MVLEAGDGTSLVVQWLRLHALNQCRGLGFHPWSGNQIPHAVTERSCMLQQRSKILSATVMSRHSQINVVGEEKTLVIQRQEDWRTVTFGNVKKQELYLVKTVGQPWRFLGHLSVFSQLPTVKCVGFPDSSVGKESACNTGDPGLIPGLGRPPGEGIGYPLQYSWASLVAQLVKKPCAMRKTWV